MIFPVESRDSTRRAKAFSLIEVLVSLAVLLLIVILFTQIITSTASTVSSKKKRMDTDSRARMIFSRMALDFSAMLRRRDLDYSSFKQPAGNQPDRFGGGEIAANPQPGNDSFAFYAEVTGYFPGTGPEKSPCSLVAYQVAQDPDTGQPALRRRSDALGWKAGASWKAPGYLPITLRSHFPDLHSNAARYKTVGEQVFRMELSYHLKASGTDPARLSVTPWRPGGSSGVNGWSEVSAIVITLAVLDDASRELVDDLAPLAALLPDAVDGVDTATVWNRLIASPDFAQTAGVAPAAAVGIRVYQRYFPLNSP